MKRSVCIFDLDDCLYRSDVVHVVVRENIQRYIHERLGVPADEVEELTAGLYVEYGTTLAGLMAKGYKVDFDDWHKHVHYDAIDYDTLIHPDPLLRSVLEAIDLPKHVFTNADTVHAEKCLARLGIRDLFESVYHFESVMDSARTQNLLTKERPVMCKPMPEAYNVVLRDLGISAQEAFFADDSARNATAAHDLGLLVVFVGKDVLPEGVRADVALATLHDLPRVLPRLLACTAPRPPRMVVDEAPVEHVESGVPIKVTAA